MRKINGMEVDATEFFYDGCHKIYVADTDKGYEQMREAGWKDDWLYPIDELPAKWAGTCPLRFINSADLERTFVRQCETATFEGWDMGEDTAREIKILNIEQMEANGEITAAEYVRMMDECFQQDGFKEGDEMAKVFDTHGGDSKLNHRSGEEIEVLGKLDPTEYDEVETGPMYRIRFADGVEADAFADEIKEVGRD